MSNLHVYFALRNQQAFQRLLEGGGARAHPAAPTGGSSSGGGRSWTKPSPLSIAPNARLDVNARDGLGRSVLHLACAATDPAVVEFVRMLLAHPAINVNVQDAESHWTPLHRALYSANIAASILLLQRNDVDVLVTDLEGNTPFDLYDTTVYAAGPSPRAETRAHLELLTWGANRNAALGHGDGNDRALPDHVVIRKEGGSAGSDSKETLAFKLKQAYVKKVQMSRLHTVVLTDEPEANVRVCGFASTGRLGPGGGQHTQYELVPLQQCEHTIVSVALGQDHTLALTGAGQVLSWGLNRFSQLGYVVDPSPGARTEDQVQAVPRIIAGPLKKESVLGVAACKTASACWTSKYVFTWGTNHGQLGYDKNAHPVQVQPRIVTPITKPVTAIAMTDSAMACLLSTSDVVVLVADGHHRVSFTVDNPFRLLTRNFHAYRPPHMAYSIKIDRIVCNDAFFAAVSCNGEMFTFGPDESAMRDGKGPPIRTRQVMALRREWQEVRDAALGLDGSITVCTESGHVFTRARTVKSAQGPGARSNKFVRVPHVQRAIAVCANDTGAIGALREDLRPDPVRVLGNTLTEDFVKIRPYTVYERVAQTERRTEPRPPAKPTPPQSPPMRMRHLDEDEQDADDLPVGGDIVELSRLWDVVAQDKLARKRYEGLGLYERPGARPLAHGADLIVRVQSSVEFPVHRLVLAMRSSVLGDILSGKKGAHDRASNISIKLAPAAAGARTPSSSPRDLPRLAFTGCHPLAVLLLVHYLYSDQILAIRDMRIARAVHPLFASTKLRPEQIAREVEGLGRMLDLPLVVEAMQWVFKRAVEVTLPAQVAAVFDAAQSGTDVVVERAPLRPDVVLDLADGKVYCHSVVLRARTEFFECFFGEEEWTRERWAEDGTITVNLRHLESRYMGYVMRYLCRGEEGEMFERLDSVDTTDQFLDLLFGVMYAANELLLDRLLLVCASLVLEYVNTHNVCAVFADAADLNCKPLMASILRYMSANMETLLEGQMLNDLTPRLVKQLSAFVRAEQDRVARSPLAAPALEALMEKHRDWLAQEDIPQPIVRTAPSKASPRLSPKRSRRVSLPGSPMNSPSIRPNMPTIPAQTGPAGDDLFAMDDVVPPLQLDPPASAADVSPEANKAGSPWKSASAAPRVEMKAILAEAEGQKQSGSPMQRPSMSPSSTVYKMPSRAALRPAFPPGADPSEASSRPPTGLPWRMPGAPSTPTLAPAGIPTARTSPSATPTQTSALKGREPVRAASGSGIATPPFRPVKSTSTAPAPAHPGLGPVITPSRLPQASAGPSPSRNVSNGGKAWTRPPVEATIAPSAASPTPTGGMSFAEIQRLQHEQGATTPARDRRSLKEIQDEERERRQEEEFMRWWAAEEERVRAETAALVQAQSRPSAAARKGGKKGKGGPPKKTADGGTGGPDGGRGADKEKEKRKGRRKEGQRPAKAHPQERNEDQIQNRDPEVSSSTGQNTANL